MAPTKTDAPQDWSPFPMQQWIAWLAATVVAAMTMVAYAYSTFETKDAAKEKNVVLIEEMQRVEGKVDRMLERMAHTPSD